MTTAKMSFEDYRPFILDVAARNGDNKLTETISNMTEEELREWYNLGIVMYYDMI